MALEYELTLAGSTPVDQVAERALPDADERPAGVAPLLSVALHDRYGFGVTVLADRSGYVEAESDQGTWVWEPDPYVSLTFRMDKFADPDWEVVNMLTIVRRLLDTGRENVALTFNGSQLLLTRFDGVTIKHHRGDWWTTTPGADEVIPE